LQNDFFDDCNNLIALSQSHKRLVHLNRFTMPYNHGLSANPKNNIDKWLVCYDLSAVAQKYSFNISS
jgi:hypothetical protein